MQPVTVAVDVVVGDVAASSDAAAGGASWDAAVAVKAVGVAAGQSGGTAAVGVTAVAALL